MHRIHFRGGAAVLTVAFLSACAGGGAPSTGLGNAANSALPAASVRAAAAASSSTLSSCSVTATAQSAFQNGTTGNVSVVNANDMWYETYTTDSTGNELHLERYPSPGYVEQPWDAGVENAYLLAFGDNDLWVVANKYTGQGVQIAHFNGSSWQQIALSGEDAGSFRVTGISGLSTNDVWMSGNVQPSGGDTLALAHWNGTAFSVAGVAPRYGTGAGPLVEISPTDVWALTYGNQTEAADAVQWNGSTFGFHQLPLPSGLGSHTTDPVQISATGADNIWAVGTINGPTTINGIIWRFNDEWQEYLYTPSDGETNFLGVAPLDSQRTIVTAIGNTGGEAATYGYTGTDRFHAIPNTISNDIVGQDAVVPGASSFWVPAQTRGLLYGQVDLVSCH